MKIYSEADVKMTTGIAFLSTRSKDNQHIGWAEGICQVGQVVVGDDL